MSHLLDTHAFLWAAFEPHRLGINARRIAEDPASPVMVSVVSFWEIALKHALGKLALEGVMPEELPEAAEAMEMTVLELDAATAASFHRLPRTNHRDPFDRMLVWQAIRRGDVLLSCDRGLDAYADQGLRRHW